MARCVILCEKPSAFLSKNSLVNEFNRANAAI